MAKQVSLRQLKHMWPIYLLALPAALLIGIFSYYPAAGGIFHSFYEWNGDSVENFTGLDNYRQVLGSLAHFGLLLAILAAFLAARAKLAKNKGTSRFLVLVLVAFIALALHWSVDSIPATMTWLKGAFTNTGMAIFAAASVAAISIGGTRKALPGAGVSVGKLAMAVLAAAGLALAAFHLPEKAPESLAWLKLPTSDKSGLAFVLMMIYSVLAVIGVALGMARKDTAAKVFYAAAVAVAGIGTWHACVGGLIDAPAALWVIMLTLLAVIAGNIVAKGRDVPLARVLLIILTAAILGGMYIANKGDLLTRAQVTLYEGPFFAVFGAFTAWHYLMAAAALLLLAGASWGIGVCRKNAGLTSAMRGTSRIAACAAVAGIVAVVVRLHWAGGFGWHAVRQDFFAGVHVAWPNSAWFGVWDFLACFSAWHYVLAGIVVALLGYFGHFVVSPLRGHLLTFPQQIVRQAQRLGLLLALFAMLFGLWRMARTSQLPGDPLLWKGFGLTGILLFFNFLKMAPSIVAAVVIHRLRSERWQYLYRVLFVVPMIIPGMVQLLIWKFFFDPSNGPLNKILSATGMMGWFQGMGLAGFEAGKPAWLSNPDLVISALIIWGFPWVGVVGVLVYLAGLQAIGTEIYESADLDGAGSLRKLWNIEIPLMATQIRLMLILMTIGTIQDFNSMLVMLGAEGGPNGVALVPALYMFRRAFFDAEPAMGYACALGVILFFIILAMTMVNNKYVRVEK